MSNKLIYIDEVFDYFLGDSSYISECETMIFLEKIKTGCFGECLDNELRTALVGWANSTPGDNAGELSKSVILKLSFNTKKI